jgi:hypothetical protein
MATFIKDAVKVFIARENALDVAWSLSPANTLLQSGLDALGDNVTTQLLMEVENVTGVSIGSYGKEWDTYQTLNDPYDHDLEIKETGSGSCDFVATDGNNVTNNILSHDELWSLAMHLPNGYNTNTGTEATWDPGLDDKTTAATDLRGYVIIVQQKISASKYLFWVFQNCKINCTVSFANRQASRGTLSWEDARYVSFDSHTVAIDPGTGGAVHEDAVSYGWST